MECGLGLGCLGVSLYYVALDAGLAGLHVLVDWVVYVVLMGCV